MSEIRVTTLKDTAGSNSSTAAEIFNGRAKAWVNFDGTGTVAIRADYNVNTITDNGPGDYTVNFTTAFADANYSFALSKSEAVSEPSGYNAMVSTIGTTSSTIRVRIRYNNGVIGDDDYVCATIFR